jgi:hypothetical protein
MTQLQAREVSGGLTAVRPSFKFDDNGSQVGAFGRASDGDDAGGWAFIPNGYLSWALNKDLYRRSGHRWTVWQRNQVRQAVEGQCAVERVRHQDDQHQPLDRLSGE